MYNCESVKSKKYVKSLIENFIGYISIVFLKLRDLFFQSFAWSTKMSWSVSTRMPYVVEVCEDTFVRLNDLLARVGEGLADDRIPSQEQECMVVAGLNLLRLQVYG